MKNSNVLLAIIFLSCPAVMMAADLTHFYIYAGGAALVAAFAFYRLRFPLQFAVASLTLLFASLSVPTLAAIAVAIYSLSVCIFLGSAFSDRPWKRERRFSVSETADETFPHIAEVVKLAVIAFMVAVVTSIFSSVAGIRANGLVIFIFILSAGVLAVALVTASVSRS